MPGEPKSPGARDTFADVAATLAEWFGVTNEGLAGRSFLNKI